jgi:Uncharacterized protein conserved in bacteria (DUF2252)
MLPCPNVYLSHQLGRAGFAVTDGHVFAVASRGVRCSMTEDEVSATATPSKSSGAKAGAATVSDVVSDDLLAQQETVRQQLAKAVAQEVVAHPSVEERQRNGRVVRAETLHEELGVWEPPAGRADPVALLEGQETSRVQELVPVRHARMALSAFAFYRGAALLMAADLAAMPRSGLQVQLCGDAHLSNFGVFAAPDRSVVFDVNDFDETNPGPFEWDVKRLATSFVLAARDNGLAKKAGPAAAEAVSASYRAAMASLADKGELEIWYDRIDVSGVIAAIRELPGGKGKRGGKKEAKEEATIQGAAAKARLRDAWSAIEKITEVVDGRRRFRDQPPLLTRLDLSADTAGAVNGLFREYRATLQDDRQELLKRYEIVDMGHKVVGVGSVGLLAFVLLLRGLTTGTSWSCRSSRRKHPSWRPSPTGRRTPSTVTGWSPGSGSCKRPVIRSWAGSTGRPAGASTCASCGT